MDSEKDWWNCCLAKRKRSARGKLRSSVIERCRRSKTWATLQERHTRTHPLFHTHHKNTIIELSITLDSIKLSQRNYTPNKMTSEFFSSKNKLNWGQISFDNSSRSNLPFCHRDSRGPHFPSLRSFILRALVIVLAGVPQLLSCRASLLRVSAGSLEGA